MIALVTRRFILIGLILAMLAMGLAVMVANQPGHSRPWVAGQNNPCATDTDPSCRAPKSP